MLHIGINSSQARFIFGVLKQSLSHTHNGLSAVGCSIDSAQQFLPSRLHNFKQSDKTFIVEFFCIVLRSLQHVDWIWTKFSG